MSTDLVIIGLVAVLALSAVNWRWSIKTVLVLVVVEGAIRKWVLPQASDAVYFLKDFVLLGAYLRYFAFGEVRTRAVTFADLRPILLIVTAIVFLQAFNPALGSSVAGLFGFKAYLWYVPLCFMLPDLFRSEAELERFLLRYLLLVIPVCALGILQFFAPPSSPINTYVATQTDITTFGEANRVRITGTFSYITGHGTYTFVSIALLFGLIGSAKTNLWRFVILGELALLTGSMFMTGSRGPVLGIGLLVLAFVWLGSMGQPLMKRLPIGSLLLAVAICTGAVLYFFGDALTAFVQRATSSGSDSSSERVIDSFTVPLEFVDQAGVTGFGAGATHPGAAALRQRLELAEPRDPPPGAEVEAVRLLLELGFFGLLAWYALRLYLVWALWRTYRTLTSSVLRHLALAGFLVHAIQFSGQLVLNHTFGVYYWFLSGFIFLLPQLDEAACSQESWVASNDRTPILV